MKPDHNDLPPGKLFTSGGNGGAATDRPFGSVFSADDSLNREFPGASQQDGLDAINAAREAQCGREWLGSSRISGRPICTRFPMELLPISIGLPTYKSRDTGKTLTETNALAQSAAATFRYFAAVCETSDEALTKRLAGTTSHIPRTNRSVWWRLSRRGTRRSPVTPRKSLRHWRPAMLSC